ncbi:MAG: hypothetical protein QXF56_02335 [Candidatus Micrarchaeia archaeon]
MPVKVEEKYTLGGHELKEFKLDERGEFLKGKAGPYSVLVDSDGVVFLSGVSQKTKREWTAKYLKDRFWISVKEGNNIWSWPVCIIEKEPHFSQLPLVDSDAFKKAGGKGDRDLFLTFEGVRNALKLHEKGKLKLAEDKEHEKMRAQMLKNIIKYEKEIEEAAKLFEDVSKLRKHPEVLKFSRKVEEKPVLTEEKAQILLAIDSLEKAGEKATGRAVVDWLMERKGVEEAGLGELMKVGMLLGQVESEGYVVLSKEKGRVLTEFGRRELERYKEKTKSYVV